MPSGLSAVSGRLVARRLGVSGVTASEGISLPVWPACSLSSLAMVDWTRVPMTGNFSKSTINTKFLYRFCYGRRLLTVHMRLPCTMMDVLATFRRSAPRDSKTNITFNREPFSPCSRHGRHLDPYGTNQVIIVQISG